MVGVVRLKISATAGTKITLRHAEMLNPDGTIYTANLRGAPSVDVYICKGGGDEIWQPKFTFHGFRYVELTGVSAKPPMDAVTGIVYGSDTPKAGEFTCSDKQVNQLQSNIVWGQRGNYLSVPTDCPQRDERLGWMGDAQVFVKTATYNSDVAAFFTKWLVDVTDSQDPDGRFPDVAPFAGPSKGTPAWGDAGVICPWTIYQTYGDLRLLERQYPSMVAWVNYTKSQSKYGIRSDNRGSDYGDWLSIGADTDKELIGTAYAAYSTRLVAQAAAALGRPADAQSYEAQFQAIRRAFIEKYVLPDGRVAGNTQCGYVMALKFDLLPAALRESVANHLERDIIAKHYHLSTGFVGVSYLLPELTKAGKIDTAYRLLQQDTFPSWLFSVKMGATTIWERWDGWTPDKGFQDVGMNSFNHYSLGSCGEWLYGVVAGIQADPAVPGFKQIIIRPVPGGKLTEASGRFRSIHGLITSDWNTRDGNFTLNTTIPANTTATVHVPSKDPTTITESGKPVKDAEGVKFLRMENGAAVFAVESGSYQFAANGNLTSAKSPATGRKF
jgi:alpha-L-rhamnosidase